MDFLQVVEHRRAVRQYLPATFERSVIERLIGTAVLAPSAMNLQPWAFAVVRDVARIDGYAERAKQHLVATSAVPASLREMLAEPTFSSFYHAPVLILVLARTADEQAREDCCLAAQTLMLAARNEGLGTCWIGLGRSWLNLPATKTELGIAGSYHVVAPIVLGHAAAWPESHGRRAPDIHWLDGD
jgi:nitroreductase